MPGGPARLFLAVWFESFVLGISAGIAATVVRVFVPPLFGYGGDASVLTAIAGMAVGVFGLWAAQWFPPISKLLSDHFTVRRSVSRAKNFRAA